MPADIAHVAVSFVVPVTTTNVPNVDQTVVAPVNNHMMQTRAKSGISKRKIFMAATRPSSYNLNEEPTSFSQASKHSVWMDAITGEFDALQKQHIWSLTP